MQLSTLDVIVLVVCMAMVMAVAVGSTFQRFYKSDNGTETNHGDTTAEHYFLSGRNLAWWAVGGSLFASNIGTEHFIGQAGSACSGGIAVGLYEWTAILLLLSLGYIFAPIYLQGLLSTVPQYFENRFGPNVRWLLAVITLFSYITTKISSSLFAGTLLLKAMMGWDMWKSVPIILLFTGTYTIGGGLKAVIYTDCIQMVIFVIGGLIGAYTAFGSVDGYTGLYHTLEKANLSILGHLFRPVDDIEYPFTGMLLGNTITSVWYWCMDQEMIQRIFSTRELRTAKAGVILAGYLKLLPMVMIVFPGLIARALYERCQMNDQSVKSVWCDVDLSNNENANIAYPLLVMREFPSGLVGLMLASMLSAMMSSLSSVFHSASTVFTMDIYARFVHPNASERRLVFIGRCTTFAMVALSMLWLPVIASQHDQLYLINQSVLTHLAPTLATVFLLGIFYTRANGPGAIAGIIVGVVFGMCHLIVSFVQKPVCDAAMVGRTIGGPWFACMQFNHFAIILFVTVGITCVAVSLLTDHPTQQQLHLTTYWSVRAQRTSAAFRMLDVNGGQRINDAQSDDIPQFYASRENHSTTSLHYVETTNVFRRPSRPASPTLNPSPPPAGNKSDENVINTRKATYDRIVDIMAFLLILSVVILSILFA